MVESRLQVVGQELAPDPFPVEQPKPPVGTKFAGEAIALALSALSQRALVALSNLFVLAVVGSVFVLWYVTPDPNVYQLVKLAMYGVFSLGISWIVRRR
jgi:hypothetical protein